MATTLISRRLKKITAVLRVSFCHLIVCKFLPSYVSFGKSPFVLLFLPTSPTTWANLPQLAILLRLSVSIKHSEQVFNAYHP